MVAAGVFLLATVSVYIGFTSIDLVAIAVVGAVTLIYAASMAMVQSDIKRVIAFSTVSQLGYMVLVIGAGFSMVGLYHLFTHAFFKALLFLAAGSVIHAVATQNMFQMGGLRKPMRVTATAFVIGGLALTGVPPFAGFFSKDDVLTSVYDQAQTAGHAYLWPLLGVAVATVFLTGYYIFRAYYLTFSGDRPRDPTIAHVHESPWSMRVPLLVLSGFAIVAGLLVYWPTFATLFDMGAGVPAPIDALDIDLSSLWTVVGVAGIVVAWRMWGNGRVYTLPADSAAQGVRRVLLRRYYLKEAYDWFGLRAVYALARFTEFVDTYVVDGTIRGLERMFSAASGRLRRLQSGVVSDYAAYVATGLVAGLLFLVFVGPYLAKMFGGG
jgi:NADH-quinone oxidoreductase subunit L